MHFIARNDRYPQFSFCVPALRPFLKQKGRLEKDSTVVRFTDRILDTKAQGYSVAEAEAIRQQLAALVDAHVKLDYSDDMTEDRGVQARVETAALPIKVKGKNND